MGRKLLESVATFSGYELDKLQKDFTVERHELEDGTLEIISPIEVVYRTPQKYEGKASYLIEHELVPIGRKTKTKTSTRYHILTASEILERMFTTEVYDAIRDSISSVGISKESSVIVKFKEEDSNLKVLDANRYDLNMVLENTPSEFVRKDFSKYHPIMQIRNSVDRTIAVSALAGLYRLICSNGLYDLTNMFGDEILQTGKRRHFTDQKEYIMQIVDESIQALPRFADTSNKVNSFRDQEIRASVPELHEILDSWIEEKRKVPTIQKNSTFMSNAENLYKVWRANIHKVENLLDLENLMGYFKNKERFGSQVAVLSKELENRLITVF